MASDYSLVRVKSRTNRILSRIRKLPQARGYRAQIIAALFVVIAVILAWLFPPRRDSSEDKKDSKSSFNQVGLGLYFGLILAAAELLRRFSLLGEEVNHLQTRYEDKKIVLLHKVFGVEILTSGAVFIDILGFAACCYVEPSILDDIRNYAGLSALVVAVYLLYFGIIKSNNNAVDLDTALDKQPMMAAHGIACSHFFGYIKIMFRKVNNSSTNQKDEGFIQRLEKYERTHNIRFASRKLHVIVPDSCNIDRPLDYFGMTKLKQGVSVTINRAGRDCPYEILVCKMDQEGSTDPMYVMVDIPRALVTLKEMKDAGISLYSLHPSELVGQVQAFGSKLKELIQKDEECCDHVDIIPITDIDHDSIAENDGSRNTELTKLIRNHILETSDLPTDICVTST